MLVSIVIKTHNEAPRLRLVLASLYRQTFAIVTPGATPPGTACAAEIIVADDGSTDDTPAHARVRNDKNAIAVVRLEPNRGRSAAANAGARAASGEVLLFLDGDTLAAPDLVERHAAAHENHSIMGRGENGHIRSTRYFLDPETGSPQPGCEEQVRRWAKTPGAVRHARPGHQPVRAGRAKGSRDSIRELGPAGFLNWNGTP